MAPPAAEFTSRLWAIACLVIVHVVAVVVHARRLVEAGAGVVVAPAADAAVGASRGEMAWPAAVAAFVAIGAFACEVAHLMAAVAFDRCFPIGLGLGGGLGRVLVVTIV